MAKHSITLFRTYPLQAGQKIRIEGGPRAGDWQVVAVGDKTVTLRCPVSGREFQWARFVYHVEDRDAEEWPRTDG
jgi:hypothetical protein